MSEIPPLTLIEKPHFLKVLQIVTTFIYIVIIVIVFTLILYIAKSIRESYPQLVLPYHSEPFEKYMDWFYTRLITLLKNKEVTAVLKVPPDAVRVENWKLYFMFSKEVSSPNSLGNEQNLALMKEEKFLNRSFDAKKDPSIVATLSAFARTVAGKASQLATSKDASHLTAAYIHELDMMLNQYFTSIQFSYNSRKVAGFTFQINIFTMYLGPFLSYIVNEKIKPIWTKWEIAKTASMISAGFNSETVRNAIINLPLTVIRQQGYTNYKDELKNELQETFSLLEKPANLDMRENFVTALIDIAKGLISIAKFFATIPKVAVALVKIVTNPFKLIFVLVAWLICFAIMVVYFVIGALMGLLSYLIAPVVLLWIKLVSTMLWIAMMLLMIAIYFVLWLADLLTGGVILTLLRCENLPDAWYNQPGYALGNIYQRFILCHATCSARYAPNGIFCKRIHPLQPAYCPQQVIAKFHTSNNAQESLNSNPIYFDDDLSKNVDFWMSDSSKQLQMVLDTFRARRNFLEVCDRTYAKKHDRLIRSVCKNVFDPPPAQSNMTVSEDSDNTKKIKMLCQQIYCINRKTGKFNVTKDDHPSTGKICNQQITTTIDQDPEKPHIYTNTLTIMTVLILFVISLVAMSSFDVLSVPTPTNLRLDA